MKHGMDVFDVLFFADPVNDRTTVYKTPPRKIISIPGTPTASIALGKQNKMHQPIAR